ncbi:MAG: hypothetical protein V7745_05310 [Pseudomonadales bacterium]
MRIAASILPPITSQSQLQQKGEQGKPESAREVFAELVDDNLSVPLKVVTEIDSASPQAQLLRERIDLALTRDQASPSNELPLNNQRAVATYQSIATNASGLDDSVVGLDIIV